MLKEEEEQEEEAKREDDEAKHAGRAMQGGGRGRGQHAYAS